MECLEQVLNVSLLNIIANYVSDNCLIILNPNIKNIMTGRQYFPSIERTDDLSSGGARSSLMTFDQLQLYLKYMFDEHHNADEISKLKLLKSFTYVIENLYYFLGKCDNITLNELIKLDNPIFDDDDLSLMIEQVCYGMDINYEVGDHFLTATYVNINLKINSDDIYRYIKKCLENDKTGFLFYVIVAELPSIYQNKIAYQRILAFVLGNMKFYHSENMDLLIYDVGVKIRKFQIFNYLDIFMTVKDKLTQDNLHMLITNAIYQYNIVLGLFSRYNDTDYQNILKLVRSDSDRYMKLALRLQDLCIYLSPGARK